MTDTLCYFTTFVCHYDQLPLVAKRYQERIAQIASPRSAGRHRKTAGPFVVKYDNRTCG